MTFSADLSYGSELSINISTFKAEKTASVGGRGGTGGTTTQLTSSERMTNSVTLPFPKQLSIPLELDWSMDEVSSLKKIASNLSETKEQLMANPNEAITNTLKRISAGAMDTLGGRGILQNEFGQTITPLREIFFNGVQHRRFSWDWDLAPRNPEEAKLIDDTINALMLAAAPESLVGGLSRLPDEFHVSFPSFLKLPKLMTCACTGVIPDYTAGGAPRFQMVNGSPDGYASFINLKLDFSEVDIVDRQFLKG